MKYKYINIHNSNSPSQLDLLYTACYHVVIWTAQRTILCCLSTNCLILCTHWLTVNGPFVSCFRGLFIDSTLFVVNGCGGLPKPTEIRIGFSIVFFIVKLWYWLNHLNNWISLSKSLSSHAISIRLIFSYTPQHCLGQQSLPRHKFL